MVAPETDDSDYRDYLEFFNDDGGRRPKLSRVRFLEYDEELIDLITLENIRRHSPEQRARQNFLLYLLQSYGTTYGSLSPACKLELAHMSQLTRKTNRTQLFRPARKKLALTPRSRGR